MRFAILTAALVAITTHAAEDRLQKVVNDASTVKDAGYWIYNDLPKAFAEAKSSGKPILAVLRCVP